MSRIKPNKTILNVNIHLMNKDQEKAWNELPELYTNSQRVQFFINYYIVHNKKRDIIMKKLVTI